MRFKIYFRNNLIVPHCLDEDQNEDETGIDCGGSCKPCQGMHFAHVYFVIGCIIFNLPSISTYMCIFKLYHICSVSRNKIYGT